MVIQIAELARDPDGIGAMRWFRSLAKTIGPGFRPDTAAAEYIKVEDGQRLFDDAEAARIDGDVDRAMRLLTAAGHDPYAIALRVGRRQLGMPLPS